MEEQRTVEVDEAAAPGTAPKVETGSEAIVAECGLEGERGILTLRGELDLGAAPTLQAEVVRLIAAGARDLVVDFSLVSFFDSACLNVLVSAQNQADEHGLRLTLRNISPETYRVFEITGLTKRFAFDADQG